MLRNNNFLIKTSKAKVIKPKENEFRGWGDSGLEKSDCSTPENKGSSWKRELI